MRVRDLLRAPLTVLAIAIVAAPAAAQQPAAPDAGQGGEPKLVFDREIFHYPGKARRDPFRPLTATAAGPLFTDLKLNMILYSDDPGSSIVSVTDASLKQYRLRRGDSVGNATVVDIGPTRVVFSVLDFGIRRQEILNLKEREGA
jgi:hypothetical protein